jgi:glycosyltransferase involved in cell wall biosynthesis
MIRSYASESDAIRGIKLSKNFGHQPALLAGMTECRRHSDCLITIDADLQDDPGVIRQMVEKYMEGFEIVYGVRRKRVTDSWFKRRSAEGFYRMMALMGVKIIFNHADFRLVSSRALDELEKFPEVNLFLRGIFPVLGFNHCEVYYDRLERNFGETKYSLARMLSFAFEGIYSFSVKPLQLITRLGFIIFFLSMGLMIYAVWGYLAGGAVPGWFSTVLPFYFLGGVQILCIGILGEYIGKIYKEVKRRPRYIVEEFHGFSRIP